MQILRVQEFSLNNIVEWIWHQWEMLFYPGFNNDFNNEINLQITSDKSKCLSYPTPKKFWRSSNNKSCCTWKQKLLELENSLKKAWVVSSLYNIYKARCKLILNIIQATGNWQLSTLTRLCFTSGRPLNMMVPHLVVKNRQ